jgi:hypothetical protein
VAGFCEHGTGLPGSIKGRHIRDHQSDVIFSETAHYLAGWVGEGVVK